MSRAIEKRVQQRIEEATPQQMDLRKIGCAGAKRQELLDKAEAKVGEVVDELVRVGEDRNIELASKVSGIARSTLYRRLAKRGISVR